LRPAISQQVHDEHERTPLIFFSWSPDDGEPIVGQLVGSLDRMVRSGRVRVWDGRQSSVRETWQQTHASALTEATILVVIVTPRYPSSSQAAAQEFPLLAERKRRGELKVVLVVEDESRVSALPQWLNGYDRFPPRGSLSQAGPEANGEFHALVSHLLIDEQVSPTPAIPTNIRPAPPAANLRQPAPPPATNLGQPTLDTPSVKPIAILDDEARFLVRIAAFLGPKYEAKQTPTSPSPVRVSFTTLVGACLFAQDSLSEWLRDELDDAQIRRLCERLDVIRTNIGHPPDGVPAVDDPAVIQFEGETWSRSARKIAEAAAVAARRTVSGQVTPRHLFGAALAVSDAPQYFHAIDIDLADLRERFLGYIALEAPQELEQWEGPGRGSPAPLIVPKAALRRMSANTVRAVEQADRLAEPDGFLLGVEHLFVTMLTSVEDDDAIGPRLVRDLATEKLGGANSDAVIGLLRTSNPHKRTGGGPARGLYAERELIEWIHEARRFIAAMPRGGGLLTRNHLIAVAVGSPSALNFTARVEALFAAAKSSRAAVADRFYDEVSRTLSSAQEDAELLNVWSLRLRGKPVRISDVERASIEADVAPKHDRLEFEHEARAFALLCSSSIVPPLSIGLFGDWGSGKSFFMRLMRDEVKKLKADLGAPTPVQIEFNAWHYASGDVYASLAHRLFSELHREFTDSTQKQEQVETLLDKLHWSLVDDGQDPQRSADEAWRRQVVN